MKTLFTLRTLSPKSDMEDIEQVWCALAPYESESYFLSWGWVQTWLRMLPLGTNLKLAVHFDYAGPKMAFFVGNARIRRHHILTSNAFYLNETGDPEYDQLFIEHNCVVARSDAKVDILEVLSALPPNWEELYLSGLRAESPLLLLPAPYTLRRLRQSPSPFVELDRVRKVGDYVTLLSSSTRSQIRRSYRLYAEEFGEVELDVAESESQAERFFAELVELHQRRWEQKGAAGAFANRFFHDFHRSLIHNRFETGEIQLLRVRAGRTTIGCLYNFVLGGVVYFYQSGFNYAGDNRLKPGFVTHTEAVRFNAAHGKQIYDFMGGSARYKNSLATSSRELVWAVISKPKIKFSVENWLREWKRKCRVYLDRTHARS